MPNLGGAFDLFDFCLDIVNNEIVMSYHQSDLFRWLHRNGSHVEQTTLGQLIILVELASGASVAAIGQRRGLADASTAVNYRQKLNRLERSLGLGRLTFRDGSVTRPTETGRRVAREAELFLQELRSIAAPATTSTWVVGSGEAWLQSVIVPAVVTLTASARWEVKNLRAREIGEQLRAGKIHFGFLRIDDAREMNGLEGTGAAIPLPGYKIMVRCGANVPSKPAELVRWLIRNRLPLVQQGTTWAPLSELIDRQLGLRGVLRAVDPHVLCENHVQAANAITEGDGWCIVPAVLGRKVSSPVRITSLPINSTDHGGLFVYPRALARFAAAEQARERLRRELGRRLAELRS